MSNAITISGSTFTVKGVVNNQATQEGVVDLHVLVYDKDVLRDDFLGIAVTDPTGAFSLSFQTSKFRSIVDYYPDLYFIVQDGGLELLNTRETPIEDAKEDTPPITLEVDLSGDKMRQLINKEPVAGWVGGFMESDPKFAYPHPDLHELPMLDNLENIDLLERQQKVVWPEFSWNSKPQETDIDAKGRCYQMFAPDISRLGYTKEGRIYSIICPQQGTYIPHLGTMNVEVTVTGNRGWADETSRTLAADMGVEAKIWFSRDAQESGILGPLVTLLEKEYLGEDYQYFPSTKAKAIRINTFRPGFPDQAAFPLKKGLYDGFPIPDFAKHEDIAWSVGNLEVEIGAVIKTGHDKIDKFNELVVDIFNLGAGNMLKENNILTWNVWFTAPELVNVAEWKEHAEKWRHSIDVDHASPDGNSSAARYFDGTPFEPMKILVAKYLKKLIVFIVKHYFQGKTDSKEAQQLLAMKDKVEKEEKE